LSDSPDFYAESRTATLAARALAAIEPLKDRQRDHLVVTRAKSAFSSPLKSNPARIALVCAALATLAACGGRERPTSQLQAAQINTIGVNAYLWRAALDTVSFAPLLQADSAGGVIVTDWYANPNNPGERVKLTVTILDQDLRADALRVAASRQVTQNGTWVEAPVQAATVQKLEDIILTKARDLRRKALDS
jgi:hypothetical protein